MGWMTDRGDVRYGGGMPVRAVGARRLLVVLATAVGVALLAPLVAVARDGEIDGGSTAAAANTARPFTLDLSARGDFVAQTNFVQCVGASMQMMLNMIEPTDDRTAATQADLQVLARTHSGSRPGGGERKGASVRGWTAGLNILDAGPYRTVGSVDIHAALKLAARAMRATNRPVGLLVWRGRHAWVMAGFTATADPRLTNDFEVTSVIVMDPLYPYGSKTWGPSPKPRESLSVADLGRQFVPRNSRNFMPGGGTEGGPSPGIGSSATASGSWSQPFAGKYVIVMPYRWATPVRAYPSAR
jgi:hypothetical protein